MLKGFSIIIIVLWHLSFHAIHKGNSIFVYFLSSFMVPIFFFLSGYGLTESANKKGTNNFFIKKVIRIYIPFVLLNTVWVILNYALLNQYLSFRDSLLSILGFKLIDRNYWYILLLLFWYVIFYFIYNLNKSKKYKLILFWVVSILLFLFTPKNSVYQINAFNFTLGVSFSFYSSDIKKIILKYKCTPLLVIISSLFLISLKVLAHNKFDKQSYIHSLLTSNLPMIGMLIIIILGLKLVSMYRLSTFYTFIGKISFEIYLIHGAFMYSYDFILYKLPLPISFLIYLGFIIILSIYLHKFLNILTKFLSSKFLNS